MLRRVNRPFQTQFHRSVNSLAEVIQLKLDVWNKLKTVWRTIFRDIMRGRKLVSEKQDGSQPGGGGVVNCKQKKKKGGKTKEKWADKPTILRKIFEKLEVEDLLNCSVVNKLWNVEARTTLRDKKRCIAHVGGKRACEDLVRLDAQLEKMGINPFNGIAVVIDPDRHSKCLSSVRGRRCDYSRILKIPMKYVKVDWRESGTRCPALAFIMSLFSQHGDSSIEEFFIESIPRGIRLKMPLGNLKVLRFADELCCYHPMLLEDLISAAPMLEELHVDIVPEEVYFLPKSQLKVVKKLAVSYPDSPEDEEFYLSFMENKSQLQKLMCAMPDLSVLPAKAEEKFWKMVKNILVNNVDSLEVVNIDMRILLGLRIFDIPPLKKVRQLKLALIPCCSNASWEAVCRFIWKTFPRLNSLDVFPRMLELQGMLTSNVVFEETYCWLSDVTEDEKPKHKKKHRALQITELSLDAMLLVLDPTMMNKMPKLIPHVKDLSFDALGDLWTRTNLEDLWKYWAKLERLTISNVEWDGQSRLDSLFCGISEAELNELKGRSSKFLRNVHIVPTYPALTHFRNLKQLTVGISELSFGFRRLSYVPLISQISAQLVFTRMSRLKVIVKCPRAALRDLKTLEPFITIQLV